MKRKPFKDGYLVTKENVSMYVSMDEINRTFNHMKNFLEENGVEFDRSSSESAFLALKKYDQDKEKFVNYLASQT